MLTRFSPEHHTDRNIHLHFIMFIEEKPTPIDDYFSLQRILLFEKLNPRQLFHKLELTSANVRVACTFANSLSYKADNDLLSDL